MISIQEQDDLAARYRKLNESYSKCLIFHSGIDAGFFAEFKYMVHSVLFCLEHKIQFRLYSRDANYGIEKGWDDFFQPFCAEVNDSFHSKWNVHSLPEFSDLRQNNRNIGFLSLLIWKIKTDIRGSICRFISRRKYGKATLSTFDLPQDVPTHFYIPELGIDCDYLEAFKKISLILWRLNENTSAEADNLIAALKVPADFVGMQIRGGDKASEIKLFSPQFFVNALKKISPLKDVLLLTDDYGVIETLRKENGEFNWYSLCTPEERGYYNSAFTHTRPNAKREQMVRFLAQISTLLKCKTFIGSMAVSPSLFIMEMVYPAGVAVDCAPEELAHAAVVNIFERNKIANNYLKSHPAQE